MLTSRPTTVLGRNGVTASLLCICPDLWHRGTPMLASSGYVACMGCGVCVAHCPQEAICLVRELARGTLLEIRELTARVTSES